MKSSFLTSRAVIASGATALVMAAIGGTAAFAGSPSKQQPNQVAKPAAAAPAANPQDKNEAAGSQD